MHDMLVKLYDLKHDWSFVAEQKERGIVIRKPIAPEKSVVLKWVTENFSEAWTDEVNVAISSLPFSCFIAVKDEKLIGFACYDSTTLGFFGPTGVSEICRGKGTGKALLMACMLDMRLKGYGYAVIGGVGPAEFYCKTVNAVTIPESSPGVYENMLSRE